MCTQSSHSCVKHQTHTHTHTHTQAAHPSHSMSRPPRQGSRAAHCVVYIVPVPHAPCDASPIHPFTAAGPHSRLAVTSSATIRLVRPWHFTSISSPIACASGRALAHALRRDWRVGGGAAASGDHRERGATPCPPPTLARPSRRPCCVCGRVQAAWRASILARVGVKRDRARAVAAGCGAGLLSCAARLLRVWVWANSDHNELRARHNKHSLPITPQGPSLLRAAHQAPAWSSTQGCATARQQHTRGAAPNCGSQHYRPL
jgi:hypothetical protein